MAIGIIRVLFLCAIQLMFYQTFSSYKSEEKPIPCSTDIIQQLKSEWGKIFGFEAKPNLEKLFRADIAVLREFRGFLIRIYTTYERCKLPNETELLIVKGLLEFFAVLESQPRYFSIESTQTILKLTECNLNLKDIAMHENLECLSKKVAAIVALIKNLANNADFWKTLEIYGNLSRKSTIDCSKFIDNTSLIDYEPHVWRRRKAPQYLLDCLRANAIDPLIPPLPPFSPIKTRLNLIPRALLSLNNEGELSLLSFLGVIWPDTRRLWDATQLPNSTRLHPHEIWHPKFWIDQCFTDNCLISPRKSSYLSLRNIGWATYFLVRKIDVICDFNLDEFPFDNQSCLIRIFTNDGDVELAALPLGIKISIPEFPTDEWEFVNFTSQSSVITFENNIGTAFNFTAYECILQVKRNPKYYLQNLLLPVILISVLAVCCILLPADSDELQFAVTIFLGFFFLQTIVADAIPKDAGIPKIGMYLIVALWQSAGDIASVIIVMGIEKINHPRVPPFWVTLIFIRIIGPFLLVDIKNTFQFWRRKFISKESRISQAHIVPQIPLELPDCSKSIGFDRNADRATEEQPTQIIKETEKLEENERVTAVLKGERGKQTWWTVARVVDRVASLIHVIIALANFFLFLFPFILRR